MLATVHLLWIPMKKMARNENLFAIAPHHRGSSITRLPLNLPHHATLGGVTLEDQRPVRDI